MSDKKRRGMIWPSEVKAGQYVMCPDKESRCVRKIVYSPLDKKFHFDFGENHPPWAVERGKRLSVINRDIYLSYLQLIK